MKATRPGSPASAIDRAVPHGDRVDAVDRLDTPPRRTATLIGSMRMELEAS